MATEATEHAEPTEVTTLATLARFATVDALEAEMRESPYVLTIEPVHHFAEGVYAREITIPKGTLLTGKIHKTRHLNIVSQGDISVWSEGEPLRRIRAPFAFVAEPGTRRVGYAHEDTVWTTVHGTSETDLAALEAELIESHDPLALPPREEFLCLG